MSLNYLVKRLGYIGLTLLVVSIIVFGITQVLPANAAQLILGEYATPEDVASLEIELGLDRSVPVQYLDWLTGIVTGNWGKSMSLALPVGEIVFTAFGRSMVLAVTALFTVTIVAIPLGVLAAVKRGKAADVIVSAVSYLGVSAPEFVTATVLLLLFANPTFGFLPSGGYTAFGEDPWSFLQHMILPVVTLTVILTAHISRQTRSELVDVLQAEFVRTAVLKGLRPRTVLYKHALRNALLPTITVIALDVGFLVGGIIVVEQVFAYPGLGRMLIFAVENRDLPLLQAGALVMAATYGFANLIADLIYAYLDPRIQGGFNRSSQQLDKGGCDDDSKAALRSIRAGQVAFARPIGRIISSFGRRSLQVVRLRTRRSMLGYHRPWGFDGSGEQAVCHRHIIHSRPGHCLAVIYRLRSAKRSHSCAFKGLAFARSLTGWGEPLRRSHVSCAAMPRHAAGVWTIEQQQHNGTLTGPRVAPSLLSWQPMMLFRAGSAVGGGCCTRWRQDRRARGEMEWTAIGTQADRRWATAWSPEQIASRLPIDFPEDKTMRISHEAIIRPSCAVSRCVRADRLSDAASPGRGRGKSFVSSEIMISERPAEVADRECRATGKEISSSDWAVRRSARWWSARPGLRSAASAAHGVCYGMMHVSRTVPHLAGHGAEAVCDAIAQTITTLPEQLRRSLTWDQGAEMAQHAKLRIGTGLQVYFATRKALGSGARTRTPMACYANTSRKEPTSAPTAQTKSSRPDT